MSKIIGIDLGTTFSAIAQLDDLGNPEVLSSIDTNRKITASAVFIKDKNVIVGDKSLEGLKTSPFNVIMETKRQMENDTFYSVKKGEWIEKDNSEEIEESTSNSSIDTTNDNKDESPTIDLEGGGKHLKKIVITQNYVPVDS